MGRSDRWVFTTATVIAVACGAKTDIDGSVTADGSFDAGPVGGQAGNPSAGRGGIGGRGGGTSGGAGAAGRAGTSGGAGRGGFGASGGNAGSGGFAGGAGIAGGGGSAGGSGATGCGNGGTGLVTGTGELDVSGVARVMCDRIVPQPCLDVACRNTQGVDCNFDECRERITNDFRRAILEGCAPDYIDIVACSLGTQDVCSMMRNCLSAPAARCFTQCAEYNNCSPSMGDDGSCGLNCSPQWAVECKAAPQGMTCSCLEGPKAGLMFTIGVTCLSAEWNATVGARCR